ncbi:MAG: DNA topoisomerase I, partial [Candidatus Neomarinimicrobiota bacterium]
QYANKVKNAQEAHEAIRPAGTQFADPQVVARELGKPAAQLYEMIWKRTLASQMKPAQKEQTVLEIVVDDTRFKATGEVLLFDGFYRVMGVPKELTQNQLPPLEEGAALACTECRVVDHQTKPPARYTEATLVKEMEKIGIGRPSTYARTIEHLLDRKYAEKQSGNLVPTYVGVALVRVLENHFEPIVDYQFTADMEAVLDEIARGREQYLSFLKSFYYGSGERPGLEQLLENRIESRRACTLPLEGDQADVELIIGSKGPYLKQGDRTRSVPAGVYLGDLKPEKVQAILEDDSANIPLGHHPRTGEPIYFRVGRYGPYLALGESRNKSVPQSISRDQIDLDWAVQWLALPRKVGVHPETGEEIQADWGKYGPYAKVGSENVALPRGTSPLDVTLEDILTAYRARQARNRKPVVLRQLGTDPETGLELVLKEGRYGPYVTDGKVNASLPRGENPETISREDCLKLIQAKRSAPPKKRRKGKRK